MSSFLLDNFMLIILVLVSGVWLVWDVGLKKPAGQTLSPTLAPGVMNRQGTLVVDVREAAAFDQLRLSKSVNMPLSTWKQALPERLAKAQKRPVVLVCERGFEAGKAARKLQKQSFEQVYVLEGGLKAWLKAGLPVQR